MSQKTSGAGGKTFNKIHSSTILTDEASCLNPTDRASCLIVNQDGSPVVVRTDGASCLIVNQDGSPVVMIVEQDAPPVQFARP